jgi:hypothetical protein
LVTENINVDLPVLHSFLRTLDIGSEYAGADPCRMQENTVTYSQIKR